MPPRRTRRPSRRLPLEQLHDDERRAVLGDVVVELPDRSGGADEVAVAIRPQAIRLTSAADGPVLAVEVKKATYLGSHMEYLLASAAGELFAGVPHVVIGRTIAAAELRVTEGGRPLFTAALDELQAAWERPMRAVFH